MAKLPEGLREVKPPPAARVLAQMSAEQRQRIEAATPLGRIATPEDVAGAVAFLASEDARHVTGATIDVNGGYFLA